MYIVFFSILFVARFFARRIMIILDCGLLWCWKKTTVNFRCVSMLSQLFVTALLMVESNQAALHSSLISSNGVIWVTHQTHPISTSFFARFFPLRFLRQYYHNPAKIPPPTMENSPTRSSHCGIVPPNYYWEPPSMDPLLTFGPRDVSSPK